MRVAHGGGGVGTRFDVEGGQDVSVKGDDYVSKMVM